MNDIISLHVVLLREIRFLIILNSFILYTYSFRLALKMSMFGSVCS